MVQGQITPGIAPGGHAVATPVVLGRHIGKCAVGRLAVIHVDQPLGEECRHVGIVGGGADEHLGIAHPAQPLVALRAIGGHAEIIAPLAPLNVGLQLVDPRIGTGKLARPRRVGANDDAGDRVRRSACRADRSTST